jgi:D-tyrosyl-tRNA(Tyr) deacylase
MRAVIQRVREAKVIIGGEVVGSIGRGLAVLTGIGKNDTLHDIEWMIEKVINLRVFEVVEGKLDRSLVDIGGDLLLISQFTLYGDCRKGRRPSFSEAMEAGQAKKLFELFVAKAREKVSKVETGIFQASMDVSLVNEGPVTLVIDSRT